MPDAGAGELRCSFCHKTQSQTRQLISSPADDPRAYICDECITACHGVLAEGGQARGKTLSAVMPQLSDFAEFSPQKMVKTDIARGETLFVGLNCFEPGQEHAAHVHAGQDKFYLVLNGEAEIQVGEEKKRVGAGGGAFAASGVTHAVRNCGQAKLVVLAVLAPPPAK